jgi:hypothetical protein
MFHQPDLFPEPPAIRERLGTADLLERITVASRRPKYAFFVLQLIAEAAGEGGSAGPFIWTAGRRLPVRDWLCDALVPTAQRDARRRANVERVRADLVESGRLPDDPQAAAELIDQTLRDRVRRSGRCNVSRAVSDLVRA